MTVDYTKSNFTSLRLVDTVIETFTGSFTISGVSGYSIINYVYPTIKPGGTFSSYLGGYDAFYSIDNVNFYPCSGINGSALSTANIGCGCVEVLSPFSPITYFNVTGFIFDAKTPSAVHSGTIYYKVILYRGVTNMNANSDITYQSQIVSSNQNVSFNSQYLAPMIYLENGLPFNLNPTSGYTLTVTHNLGYLPKVRAWYLPPTRSLYTGLSNLSDKYIETRITTTQISFVLPASNNGGTENGTLWYKVYY